MLMLFWFWCIGSGSEPQGKLVPLGQTQVCLGPVQCQVAVEVGERGFGRDQTLGGTDGFCWKLGFIESGDIQILEKKFGWHLYGIWCGTREGINKSGKFVVEFAKDHVHRTQNVGLLIKTVMAAGQLAAVGGRLVRGIGVNWTRVLQKEIVEWLYGGKQGRIVVILFCHHGGAGIDRYSRQHGACRRPALTHLVDFGSDSVKVEPIIVGLVFWEVDRWRGAGGVAQGKAGTVAGGAVNLGRRPSAHQFFNFGFEGAVIVVVSIVCWREWSWNGCLHCQCLWERRTRCGRLSVDIVVMAIDDSGSWGKRGNPGRDFP